MPGDAGRANLTSSPANGPRTSRLAACLAGLVRRGRRALRGITGMPDYEAYLEHLRCSHPERPVPSPAEFFELYLESRYGGGTGRCC